MGIPFRLSCPCRSQRGSVTVSLGGSATERCAPMPAGCRTLGDWASGDDRSGRGSLEGWVPANSLAGRNLLRPGNRITGRPR